jgi:hypothetical protein
MFNLRHYCDKRSFPGEAVRCGGVVPFGTGIFRPVTGGLGNGMGFATFPEGRDFFYSGPVADARRLQPWVGKQPRTRHSAGRIVPCGRAEGTEVTIF